MRYAQLSNRVLIADDDPVIRHLVGSIVKQEGYQVVSVNDGRDAVRLLKFDSDFKLAIFDMMMPHLEGIDIISYMRTEKRLARIPVMIITAASDLTLMADSFAAGATAFLAKPINPEQIQKTLRMLLPE
jgi:CheY-like chemotaxis protein